MLGGRIVIITITVITIIKIIIISVTATTIIDHLSAADHHTSSMFANFNFQFQLSTTVVEDLSAADHHTSSMFANFNFQFQLLTTFVENLSAADHHTSSMFAEVLSDRESNAFCGSCDHGNLKAQRVKCITAKIKQCFPLCTSGYFNLRWFLDYDQIRT